MGVTVSHYNLIFKDWLWAGFGLQAIVCRSQMDCITLHALAVVKCSISITAGWERAGEEACVCESWDDTLHLQMGTSFSIHPIGSPLHLERSLMLMSIQVERKTPATLSHDSSSIAAKLLAWRQELHLAMVASWTQMLGRARPRSPGPHQEESHCWWGLRGWRQLSWGWKMSNYDDLVSNAWLWRKLSHLSMVEDPNYFIILFLDFINPPPETFIYVTQFLAILTFTYFLFKLISPFHGSIFSLSYLVWRAPGCHALHVPMSFSSVFPASPNSGLLREGCKCEQRKWNNCMKGNIELLMHCITKWSYLTCDGSQWALWPY